LSRIPVSSLDDGALREQLHSLSLTLKLSEARKVAELLGRDPSETELTLFDTMWSEHCSYKSSRGVLKEFLPTDAGNVILGPGEDAGVLRFCEHEGKRYAIVLAHESHNHPSQVMPVEGAATGIGGVVRDVYCMGADVVATLDPLRFGDPEGKHGERSVEIAREVVEGIALYGNALGVPNLGGDVVFDSCYDDNCLVNVVAVGIVEEGRVIRSRVPKEAHGEPYDIILVGKPTDWSGMGGAAFASADLDHAAAMENKGSVQVPDPFLKRVLVVANHAMLDLAEREKVAIGFKDLGAGGIACVSSELAHAGGFGVELDLARASLAEEDLPPRVAACSETQERFAMAVPQRISRDVLRLYNETYDLPGMYPGACASVIGEVLVPEAGEKPRYVLRFGEETLVDAPVETITEGIRYEREAKPRAAKPESMPDFSVRDYRQDFLDLLGSPHLASRRELFQHYDSEVKANTVLRPGEADSGIVAPIPGCKAGMALTVDGNPRISRNDPYLGGALAVVEAARNLISVGAIPQAVTDCLNYGNPEKPEVFHDFREGVRGIGDACRGLGRLEAPGEPLPVISGNVSFYNQSASGGEIAPSPVVCGVGTVADISRARSNQFKSAGNPIYRVGGWDARMGGSLYAHWIDPESRGEVSAPDYEAINSEFRLLLETQLRSWSVAVHDVGEGGTLTALAEMALGAESLGRLGAEVDLSNAVAVAGETAALFGEGGGFLVEIQKDERRDFEAAAAQHEATIECIGHITENAEIEIDLAGKKIEWPLAEMAERREACFPRLLRRTSLAGEAEG
jgi:phosphoribosylformylglycinamidine synthase